MSAEAMSAALEQLRRIPGVSTAGDLAGPKPSFPVDSALRSVFPAGLPRGEITELVGPQSLSLALASVAHMSTEDRWTAAVGLGEPAVQAVADYGVSLGRFVNIDVPSRDWLRATSILIDSFAAIIVKPGFRLSPSEQSRLRSKVRERRMSLLVVGALPQPSGTADRTLAVSSAHWDGLGQGHGMLQGCHVTVNQSGGDVQLLLPGAGGRAEEGGLRLV